MSEEKFHLGSFVAVSPLWVEHSVEATGCDLTFDPSLLFETETSEDEDDEEEEEFDSDDGGCEESGLGMLARFAANAIPVSSTPPSLVHEGKHRSRLSTLGKSTTHTNELCAGFAQYQFFSFWFSRFTI